MIEVNDLNKAKEIEIFGEMVMHEHEQLVFCNDNETGLKAIIGIHNTNQFHMSKIQAFG